MAWPDLNPADPEWWDQYPTVSTEEFPLTTHKRICPCQAGYPIAACECNPKVTA